MARRQFKAKKNEDGTRPEVEEPKPKVSFTRPSIIPCSPSEVAAQVADIRKKNKIAVSDMAIQRWFKTGSHVLDVAINRGLPGGRIVELSGPETSGKTTKALEIIAEAQKEGGRGDYFDLEFAMTHGIAVDLAGVDTHPDKWELWRPDTAEMGFSAMDDLIPVVGNMGAPAVIVIDSVPAIVPQCEYETPYGEDPRLAGISRLLARVFRKNLSKLDRFPNVLLVIINHINEPFSTKPFEKPEYRTPGGKAARYYPSVRLRFDKGGGVDLVDRQGTGAKTVARERMKIMVWKNRVGSSHRVVTLPLNFVRESITGTRKGFDDARGVVEFLREEKVLINAKNKDGGATGNWMLVGMPHTTRTWKSWILAYNTIESVRDLLKEMVIQAAMAKWTPEEDDVGSLETPEFDNALEALTLEPNS